MRSVSLVEFSWLYDEQKRLLWDEFLKLFYLHLEDKEDINPFYFNLLLLAIRKWDKQNPKRVICESYINLLKYEKRLQPKRVCFICETAIRDKVSLMRGFKVTHPECIKSHPIATKKVINFLDTNNSIFLEDNEIDTILVAVMKGF